MSLGIKRYFTNECGADVKLKPRRAEIRGDDGKTIVFEQSPVYFPDSWSERAINIVASKYFRGRGEDREDGLGTLINRVAGTITQAGRDRELRGYFGSSKLSSIFQDELEQILYDQRASFNSPVWFNIGIKGVEQQASACYILDVEDTIESILEWSHTEGLIFKRGSGAGVNVSKLRAEGEPLSGGGTSSGPLSFMKAVDSLAGVIKSGGTTRRAAKMVVMDVDHPDIEQFITCKASEEKKAQALIDAGYDGRLDGEAYATVAFQNTNHSVRLTDEFMGSHYREVRAQDILRLIAQTAWECGDPGVQFTDTINEWHTCSKTGAIYASNPCSEFVFLNNTACNLASINLVKYLTVDNTIDIEGLLHTVRILITAMDILVGYAVYPTPEIAEMTQKTRPLGLGITNLGAMLIRMGIPYDSPEGRNIAAAIMSLITAEAYRQSTELAHRLGAFDLYRENSGSLIEVLSKHRSASEALTTGFVRSNSNILHCRILDKADALWETVLHQASHWGVRNAQTTLIAPAGTISFMMDCDTTGVEPLTALKTIKTMVGGGKMEIIPDCVERYHAGRVIGAEDIKNDPVLATAFGASNILSPQAHLDMIAAIQPFVSGAISKTINMPADATVEDVERVYMDAWKAGVKCLAVYRDGSKSAQPLEWKEPNPRIDLTEVLAKTRASGRPKTFHQARMDMAEAEFEDSLPEREEAVERKRLPKTRQSVTHKFRVGDIVGYLTVGLLDEDTPGEIFVQIAKEGTTIAGLLGAWAMTFSLALQYGVPLRTLIDKHRHARYEPAGFTGDEEVPSASSITDYIVQWLDVRFGVRPALDQIPLFESTIKTTGLVKANGDICTICGGILSINGTCKTCVFCGTSIGACG